MCHTRNHLSALLASLGLLLGGLGLEASARAETDKPYTVTIAPVQAKKNQKATAHVVIQASKGWHINKEFPATLKLKPPAGVKAEKDELTKKDLALAKPEADGQSAEGQFDVVLTGTEAGKKTVPGDLRFAICSESSCDPQKSAVSIELTVQ